MKVGDTITLYAIVTGIGGVEGAGEPQFVQLDIGGQLINNVSAGFCQAVPAVPIEAVNPEESTAIPPLEPEVKVTEEESVGEKFTDAPTATEEKSQPSQPE